MVSPPITSPILRRFRVGFGKTLVLQVYDGRRVYDDDRDLHGVIVGWRDALLEDLSEGELK